MNTIPVTIVGNLTDDPELRFTPSGTAVAKFVVAHNPRTRQADGTYMDGTPTFMPCTAWRSLAENAAQSLKGGMRVIVTGRLRTETWEDQASGGKRSRVVLDVDGCGPDLMFATATVRRVTSYTSPAGDEDWDTASRERPANPAPGSSLAPGATRTA